jgi:hypothetical protein
MSKFKVGDGVRHERRGIGTIKTIDIDDLEGAPYGCEFENRTGNGAMRINGKVGFCAWCTENTLTLIKPAETKLKAYDVMKAAAENPGEYEGKRYRVVSACVVEPSECQKLYEIKIRSGHLICGEVGNWAYINSHTELEPIPPEPQPVSFMEAVKAYSEGKTIRCGGTKYVSKTGLASGFGSSSSNNGTYLNCREILQGEWFIEA